MKALIKLYDSVGRERREVVDAEDLAPNAAPSHCDETTISDEMCMEALLRK